MKHLWLNREQTYDGTQLRSHWIFDETHVIDDAILAFIGPANVPIEHMVDLADVANNAPIFSHKMLHVLLEHFDADLELTITRQRLLTAIAAEVLRSHGATEIVRSGNDLYDGDRKLSVCIATASPVSSLIHFAINIESKGTPVPTKGLSDYGMDPKTIGDAIMTRYTSELESMREARRKVRAVP